MTSFYFTLQAGDTILIRGGTYKEEISFSNSGSASNWITVSNYNNEVVVVDGEDVRDNVLVGGFSQSVSNIRITGIKFINAMNKAILIPWSSDIVIQNCTIQDFGDNG